MAQAICGILYHSEKDGNTRDIDHMLEALPGLGCIDRVGLDAMVFGCRELSNSTKGSEKRTWYFQCLTSGALVIADVRLDNRTELFNTLDIPESQKNKIADCELLLHAYRQWGENCPLYLYGDYAFSIWDSQQNQLFCARDAVGARPFYYSTNSGGYFAFASDMSALLALSGMDDNLNDSHVAAFLMGDVPERGTTFFHAVQSLPPGHSITIRADAENIKRWWHPEDLPPVRFDSDDDYAREFLNLYKNAVRDRLRDTGPVGVHLSGGLDSSSIAVLAARELRKSGQRLPALCWHPPPETSLPEEEAEEYRLIESVCTQEGIEPLFHSLSVDHILSILNTCS